ncbi:DEAD/DEAH box helicase [Brackiella oedipodis]|uniref:DEAD/DEAH box helicase n=1 Tax=Brackiella oedipodis TaxID=124225 RepID=UPI0009FE8E2F|nr:DEAD/DEAH box helicase [Brackiella oedipodis]
MSFESLGLHPTVLSALQKAGFKEPTSVQSAAIPVALEGHDLIVTAQTGSGKTAAFMLPTLHRFAQQKEPHHRHAQMLILTPTRELALQIADATKMLAAGLKDLRVVTVVGGMPYGKQINALSKRVDILVATPGRLLDHLKAGRLKLSAIQTLVLDEADRMLDMGFIDDIESVVAKTPSSRQTLMFSATFEDSVAKLAEKMLRQPKRINISNQKQKHTNIKQRLFYADNAGHKYRLLDHILSNQPVYQAIVFTSTKRGAEDLTDRLQDAGYTASALHGDMNQRQRNRTLKLLQNGRLQVLVATDVAARGIDVQGITHAINYDLPMQAEDYVHRIGRTGRAGRDGTAYSFATFTEKHKVRRIEDFTGQAIETSVIEGLEPIRQSTKVKRTKGTKLAKEAKGTKRTKGAKDKSNKASVSKKDPSLSTQAPAHTRPKVKDGAKPEFTASASKRSQPRHQANAQEPASARQAQATAWREPGGLAKHKGHSSPQRSKSKPFASEVAEEFMSAGEFKRQQRQSVPSRRAAPTAVASKTPIKPKKAKPSRKPQDLVAMVTRSVKKRQRA